MTSRTENKEDLFDGILLGMAQRHNGGITDFLDTFFSFLVRKTDFFGKEEMARETIHKHVDESCGKYQKLFQDQQTKIAPKTPQVTKEEKVEVLDDEFKHEKEDLSDKEVELADKNEKLAPNAGNGADLPKYSFTQTLSELEVRVPLPRAHKSKELTVEIDSDRFSIRSRDGKVVYLEGPFTHKIRVDDAMWTLENGTIVCLQLTKQNKQEWWKSVLEGDREIDLSKVCPENSKLDDLDGETRQTVEKMMYDQRQKQMGLPTSDDARKNEMLQKFMASHPEMDFSNAKIA